MNRLMLGSNFVLSSLFFGLVMPPAMARITPEPTMCFIRMANGSFRDLTSVCGANRYMTIAPPIAPQNVAAPETLRQNTVRSAAPNGVPNGAPNSVQNAAPNVNNRTRTIRVIENRPAGSGGASGGVPGQPIVPR
jgi:hypothetical protein